LNAVQALENSGQHRKEKHAAKADTPSLAGTLNGQGGQIELQQKVVTKLAFDESAILIP